MEHGMSEYKKLVPKQRPTPVDPTYKESIYWKKYKPVALLKENAQVTSINFLQSEPYDYYVSSGLQINRYSRASNEVIGSITKLKQPSLCSHLRRDGQLLVSGDLSGELKVFNVRDHHVLRTLNAHDGPIRSAAFLQNQQILSGSDDKTVRIWDITSKTQLNVLEGHGDHVNAVAASSYNTNLVFSGSSDHTVKLWDVRSNTCTLTLDHQAPVRSILVFPGSGLLVSAGGTELRIWDIFLGSRLLRSMDMHQKEITCITFDDSGERILTGSLDHQVKVISTKDHSVMHSFKYSSPISCIAFSPNGSTLVAGMMDGLLSIKQKMAKASHVFNEVEHNSAFTGHLPSLKCKKVANAQKQEIDLLVEEERKRQLKPYDRMLKSYRYHDALDAALSRDYNESIVCALFEELIIRKAVHSALRNRDEESLRKIINFISKQFKKSHYVRLVIKITNVLLDLYSDVMHEFPGLLNDLQKLENSVSRNTHESKLSVETLGCIDAILAASKS